MGLHPLAKAFLENNASEDRLGFLSKTIDTQRSDHSASLTVDKDRQAPVHSVRDVRIPAGPGDDGSVSLRIYRPSDATDLPLYVFIHGGGWVYGELEPYDYVCRELAYRTGCVLVSVGYRRAPEHRHPGPLKDVVAAVRWCFDNLKALGADGERSVIGGDSAGGHLAATYCLKALEEEGLPRFSRQVLHYPVTAHYSFDFPSYGEYGRNAGLDKELMVWFWDHFLPEGTDKVHPLVSPLKAEDLSDLPRTLIQTAECDPLRDEGAAYAKRLKEAGVETTWTEYKGMIHGFINVPELGFSTDAMKEVGYFLSDFH